MWAAWRQTSFAGATKSSKKTNTVLRARRTSSTILHCNGWLQSCAPCASCGCLQSSEAGHPHATPQADLRQNNSSGDNFFADTTTSRETELGTSTDTTNMTLLRAAILFTTQHTQIERAAKSTEAPQFANGQTPLQGSSRTRMRSQTPSPQTAQAGNVSSPRSISSRRSVGSDTRPEQIPSPVKTYNRPSTSLRHKANEGRARNHHAILDSLACDDKWCRIGVMSSEERLEDWLSTQDVAMFELD